MTVQRKPCAINIDIIKNAERVRKEDKAKVVGIKKVAQPAFM